MNSIQIPESLRVERAPGTEHEWVIYITEPTEAGPSERDWGCVDDCDTEEEALSAARASWLARHAD